MTSWFNNLNLKPQERRLVIGVLVGLFVLVNIWFVWPHFGDWAKNAQKAEEMELTSTRYQTEVDKTPGYRSQIRELEKEGSATMSVAVSEQALQFQKAVLEIANRSNVAINRFDPTNPRRTAANSSGGSSAHTQTNAFFEELGLSIQMQQVEEENLVLFLCNLRDSNSNIRVKEMELSQHSSGNKLACKALLIASYQKAPTNTAKTVAPAARAATGGTNNRATQPAATPKTATATDATHAPAPTAAPASKPDTISTNAPTEAPGKTPAPAAKKDTPK